MRLMLKCKKSLFVVVVFKVEKKDTEFVESQEFNEDNYIGDIGNSFSSENQTVIEKTDVVISENDPASTEDIVKERKEIYAENAVPTDVIDDVNVTLESTEGEYHSFTDLEESYESPVKELVEKDIRDYSVPIDFYCDDFKARDDSKKSPLKAKNTLEPILEESKSSYGDDSNSFQNDKKEDLVENIVGNVVNKAVLASQLKLEIATKNACKVTTEALVAECVNKQESFIVNEEVSDITPNDVESFTTNTVQTAVDVYKNEVSEQEMIDSVYDNVFEILSTENESETNDVKRQNSLASTLSSNDRVSFDSTTEFEKYEAIAEVLSALLNRIQFIEVMQPPLVITDTNTIQNYSISNESSETFSIAKIIEDIEQNVCLNETILTETSDTDIGQANKVIEGILYYIFDRAMYINKNKLKGSKRGNKKVITVADFEDILFTAKPLWFEIEDFSTKLEVSDAKCRTDVTEQMVRIEECNIERSVNFDQWDNIKDLNIKEDNPNQEVNTLDELNEMHDCYDTEMQYKSDYCTQIVIYQDTKPNIMQLLDKQISDDFNSTNLDRQVENSTTEELLRKIENLTKGDIDILNETFIETSDMNNAFHEDFSQSEDPTISSHTEEFFVTPDVDLTSEIKENISMDTETVTIEKTTEQSHEEIHMINDEFRDICNQTEEFASFSMLPEANAEEYLSPVRDVSSPNEEFYSPEYRDICNKNLDDNTEYFIWSEEPDESQSMDQLGVKEGLSRSSSPNRQPIFELTESPIKNVSNIKDLHDTDITSPFVKKANVLAMSQTEHSGGVRYWLSFDENLSIETEKPTIRNVKSIDDTLPSFISIDIDDNTDVKSNEFYEKETNMKTKRSSVLLNDYKDNEVCFPSPSTSNIEFATCDSKFELVREFDPELENDNSESSLPRKRLLYELHSRPSKRLYSSWPPFEDTLFYRIISKFRMSESFDPSDLEDPNFDSSV